MVGVPSNSRTWTVQRSTLWIDALVSGSHSTIAFNFTGKHFAFTEIYELVLGAVVTGASSPITFSVIAMIKIEVLSSLTHHSPWEHRFLPKETAIAAPV
jgi:hypothetical protein